MSATTTSLLAHPVVEKHDILCELIGAVLGPEQLQLYPHLAMPSSPSQLFDAIHRASAQTGSSNTNARTPSQYTGTSSQGSSTSSPSLSKTTSSSSTTTESPGACTTLVLLCIQACTHGAATRPFVAQHTTHWLEGAPTCPTTASPMESSNITCSRVDGSGTCTRQGHGPIDATHEPPANTEKAAHQRNRVNEGTGQAKQGRDERTVERDKQQGRRQQPPGANAKGQQPPRQEEDSDQEAWCSAYELTRRFLLECSVPNTGILERPLDPAIALRQWLSVELDERRLSTTLHETYSQRDLARKYYLPHALLLSAEDLQCVCHLLHILEDRPDAPSPVSIVSQRYDPKVPIVFARNHAVLRFVATANISRRESKPAPLADPPSGERASISSTRRDEAAHVVAAKHRTIMRYQRRRRTTAQRTPGGARVEIGAVNGDGHNECKRHASGGGRLAEGEEDNEEELEAEPEVGYLCVQSPTLGNKPEQVLDVESKQHELETLQVVWTPNAELLPLTHPSRLPPGWDSAHDPVTSHNYYIHHETRTTTWTHPLANTPTPTEGVALKLRPSNPFDVYFVAADSGEDTALVALLGQVSGLATPRPGSRQAGVDSEHGGDAGAGGRQDGGQHGEGPQEFGASEGHVRRGTASGRRTHARSSGGDDERAEQEKQGKQGRKSGEEPGERRCRRRKIKKKQQRKGSACADKDESKAATSAGSSRTPSNCASSSTVGEAGAGDTGHKSPFLPGVQHDAKSVIQDAQTRAEALVLELPLFQLHHLADALAQCAACRIRQVLPQWDLDVNTEELQRVIFADRHTRRSVPVDAQYQCGWAQEYERPASDRDGVVSMDVFESFLMEDGRLSDFDALRKLLFFKPMAWDVRQKVWPFLLGVVTPWSTHAQRCSILQRKRGEYEERKRRWSSVEDKSASHVRHVVRDIVKDAARTDRGFSMFVGANNVWLDAMVDILATWTLDAADRAYSQGMSDLLAPILAVMQDEALAYWCFDALMQRDLTLFDEQGIRMTQVLTDLRDLVRYAIPDLFEYLCDRDLITMLFCYRWLLLSFKREFSMNETMMLWDLMWSQYRTRQFPVFVAAAVMKVTAPALMEEERPADQVLEFYSRIPGSLHVTQVISTAREILYQLRHDPDRPKHLKHLILFPTHGRKP